MKFLFSILSFGLAFSLAANAATPQLSYDDAMQAIIDRNPDVNTAKTALEQLRAKNLPDHLALLPTFQFEGQRNYSRSNNPIGLDPFGNVESVTYDSTVLSGTFGGKFNLFHGGADIQGMRAANSEERSAERSVESTVIGIENDAAAALNNVIQFEKDRDILQRILEMREGILRLSRERFQRGLMAEQEVNKLQVDMDNDVATLRDTQASAVDARAKLVALLGHDNIQTEWPWTDRLRKGNPTVLAIGEKVLSSRPDWQAAEEKVRATGQRKWQRFGPLLPNLDVNGSYGWQRSTYGDAPAFTSPQFQIGLTLTVPLFDRLAGYSDYEQNVYNVKLAELELEKLKRNALAEWQSARSALEISLQSARDREKTLSISRALYEDNLKRFRRGLVSSNDLSVDQGRLLSSEQLAVKGWNSAHSSFVRLCKAIGRRVKDCWHD